MLADLNGLHKYQKQNSSYSLKGEYSILITPQGGSCHMTVESWLLGGEWEWAGDQIGEEK